MWKYMLEFVKYVTGALAISSLILPSFVNFARFNAHVMRSTLNVTWAFVFGTHIWYLFFSSDDFYATGGEEGSFFNKKIEDQLSYISDECTKFFVLTLFCNSLIVVTTKGLAPYHTHLHYCSAVSLLATFANAFFVPKAVEPEVDDRVCGIVSPATLSKALSLVTCLPLVTYCLL